MSVIVRRLRASRKSEVDMGREYESLIEDTCSSPNREEPTLRELKLGQRLWNYMLINHAIRKSDVIIVLGNCDIRTAEHASRLWLEGWGEWIMFCGAFGKLTRGECIVFAHGVLKMNGILPKSITFVHQPFMERRTYATFLKQWPTETDHMQITLTSPKIKMEDYPNYDVGSLCDLISMTVGSLQRIREYPSLGFQMAQKIPAEVMAAFKELAKKAKYSSHLLGQSKEP